MLDSWFKDWKVKHHKPPTWWNKQWTSDPRPKAAHPLFQMKDLDVGSQNGQVGWTLAPQYGRDRMPCQNRWF